MLESRSFRLWVLSLVLVNGGWGPCPGPSEPPPPEPPPTVECGFEIGEAPVTRPVDACSEGFVVVGPERVERQHGQPTTESFAFDITDGGASCLAAESGGAGRHAAVSAKAWVDGHLVLSPAQLSQHRRTAESRFDLEPGQHDLGVRITSRPGTFLDVTVKTGGTEPHAVVSSDHLELSNIFADPVSFSPALGSIQLSADGHVSFSRWPGETSCDGWDDHNGDDDDGDGRGCSHDNGCNGSNGWRGRGNHDDNHGNGCNRDHDDGRKCGGNNGGGGQGNHGNGWGHCQEYLVRWSFEIRSAATCELVRTISSEHTGDERDFAPEAEWDGRDDAGEIVPDGEYLYRLVAELVKVKHDGTEEVIDLVATAQQRVLSDASAPSIEIAKPANRTGIHAQSELVEVEIHLTSEVGIDASSISLFVDGEDRLSEMDVLGDIIAGSVLLGFGEHYLRVAAADLVGNTAVGESVFSVAQPGTTQGYLDPSGGRFEITNPEDPLVGVYLENRPGAVADWTLVTLSAGSPDAPLPGAGVSLPLEAHVQGSLAFAVLLGLPYDPTAVSLVGGIERNIEAVVLEDGADTWRDLPSSSVDPENDRIEVLVGDFSIVQAVVAGHRSILKMERIAGSYDPLASFEDGPQHSVGLGPGGIFGSFIRGVTSSFYGDVYLAHHRMDFSIANRVTYLRQLPNVVGRVPLGRSGGPYASGSVDIETFATIPWHFEGSTTRVGVADLDGDAIVDRVVTGKTSSNIGPRVPSIQVYSLEGDLQAEYEFVGPEGDRLFDFKSLAVSSYGGVFVSFSSDHGAMIYFLNIGPQTEFIPALGAVEQGESLLVAGGGNTAGDGVGTEVLLGSVQNLTVSHYSVYEQNFDGLLYFTDGELGDTTIRVLNVGIEATVLGQSVPSNHVVTVIGGGSTPLRDGLTEPRSLNLDQVYGLAVLPDGEIAWSYWTERTRRVRAVSANGMTTTIGGGIHLLEPSVPELEALDGTFALEFPLGAPGELSCTKRGDILVVDASRNVLHQITYARDTDNDGVGDRDELAYGLDRENPDTDGDGLLDGEEFWGELAPVDSDNDGVIDPLDADSDNDGVDDGMDNCVLVDNPNQENGDGDQRGDACDVCPNDFDDQTDSDGDKVGDACDLCPFDQQKDEPGICGCDVVESFEDEEPDGIFDCVDNCVGVINPGQDDNDGDGIGDACDFCADVFDFGEDTDADTIDDACDNCPTQTNLLQEDTNGNGIGDACESECPSASCTVMGEYGITLRSGPFTLIVPPAAVPEGTLIAITALGTSSRPAVGLQPAGLEYDRENPAFLFYHDETIPPDGGQLVYRSEGGTDLPLPAIHVPDHGLMARLFHHSKVEFQEGPSGFGESCGSGCTRFEFHPPPAFIQGSVTMCFHPWVRAVDSVFGRTIGQPDLPPNETPPRRMAATFGDCDIQPDQVTILDKSLVNVGGQMMLRAVALVEEHQPRMRSFEYIPSESFFGLLQDCYCDETDRQNLRARVIEHEHQHTDINNGNTQDFSAYTSREYYAYQTPDSQIVARAYSDWCAAGYNEFLVDQHNQLPGHDGGPYDFSGVNCPCVYAASAQATCEWRHAPGWDPARRCVDNPECQMPFPNNCGPSISACVAEPGVFDRWRDCDSAVHTNMWCLTHAQAQCWLPPVCRETSSDCPGVADCFGGVCDIP